MLGLLCMGLLAPPVVWGQAAKNETTKQAPLDEKSLVLRDQAGGPAAPDPAGGFGFWDFVRMVLVLGGVVGLIYAFFYFLRKMTSPKSAASAISVLETQTLTGSRNLHLVEVGTHLFLIGTSEDGVRLVSEISDNESIDEIRLKISQKPAPGRPAFAELVMKALHRKNGPPPGGAGEVEVPMDFMRKQKERLKKLT